MSSSKRDPLELVSDMLAKHVQAISTRSVDEGELSGNDLAQVCAISTQLVSIEKARGDAIFKALTVRGRTVGELRELLLAVRTGETPVEDEDMGEVDHARFD